jgi:probable rRNA maturation factor
MADDSATPSLRLTVQNAVEREARKLVPSRQRIGRWARAALRGGRAEVTVRLVGEREGRELNRDFRGKDYATNVLTFVYGDDVAPAGEPADAPWWGDLVLCVPVVAREAAEQGKALEAHFAHLIVHGMLHLQGFDHEDADEADEMEAAETAILASLGYDDPYA